jgi:serine/threonine protein kinase
MTAKCEDATVTLPSQVGTPSYIPSDVSPGGDSPEQTTKADVLSFGVILDEIVCDHPFSPSTLSPETILDWN